MLKQDNNIYNIFSLQFSKLDRWLHLSSKFFYFFIFFHQRKWRSSQNLEPELHLCSELSFLSPIISRSCQLFVIVKSQNKRLPLVAKIRKYLDVKFEYTKNQWWIKKYVHNSYSIKEFTEYVLVNHFHLIS